MEKMRTQLSDFKRIIIKIGTNLLTKEDGKLDISYIKNIVKQILKLKEQGKEIILVTSGAIGAGVGELKLNGKVRDIKIKQASAAVGQMILMNEYKKYFKKQKIAQILLTYESFVNRKTYLNLRNSVSTLLDMDVVPIINENDPIAIDEIDATFGDNDKMSALVASKIEAELLIMLTTVDGLYTGDPRKNKHSELIGVVTNITSEMEKYAGKASFHGKGGMSTKLNAAGIAMDSGVTMIIANGKESNVLEKIMKGKEIGTIFLPKEKISNKKRWIKLTLAKGTVVVDEGAKKAMLNGKTLLPAGIKSVQGNFEINSVVELSCSNRIFAKAIVDYSSEDLGKIKGKHSNEIKKMLGYESYDNVLKRENLVLL